MLVVPITVLVAFAAGSPAPSLVVVKAVHNPSLQSTLCRVPTYFGTIFFSMNSGQLRLYKIAFINVSSAEAIASYHMAHFHTPISNSHIVYVNGHSLCV